MGRCGWARAVASVASMARSGRPLPRQDGLGNNDVRSMVAAVAQIDPRRGGHVRDSAAEVELYIPPNGIGSAIQVTIAPLDQNELELPADSRPSFAGPAYYIGPDTLKLVRPAILSLTLPAERSLEQPALYAWGQVDARWSRLGGILEGENKRLRAAINAPGIYALFDAPQAQGEGPVLGGLVCQPRMLSPRGGGFSSQTEISFVLGRSAAASVQIFDMTGHLVREVVRATTLSPGSNVATWDGRDQDGRIVYDGAYVVLVQAGGQRAKKIVTVVNGQR